MRPLQWPTVLMTAYAAITPHLGNNGKVVRCRTARSVRAHNICYRVCLRACICLSSPTHGPQRGHTAVGHCKRTVGVRSCGITRQYKKRATEWCNSADNAQCCTTTWRLFGECIGYHSCGPRWPTILMTAMRPSLYVFQTRMAFIGFIRVGQAHIKKKAPEACGLRGLDRGRLPTFPLSQYHRRGKV